MPGNRGFFLFFGLFHMHRIWALIDREGCASFWFGILKTKGPLYFILRVPAGLCVLGITVFIRERKHNYLWRWICVCGEIYLLFDLFAIAVNLRPWQDVLAFMFDPSSPYWNQIWTGFILPECAVFLPGIHLLRTVGNES